MTDKTCERCKFAEQYPFLDPCFQCTHHKNWEPQGGKDEKKDKKEG